MSKAVLPWTRSMPAIVLAVLTALAVSASHAAPVRHEVNAAAATPPAAAASEPEAEPEDAPVRVDPVLVKAGAERYNMYCQRCHGLNMVNQGGGSFDLRTFPLHDKARFVNSVTKGKRAMPAWGGVLRTDDLEALWNYIANHQVGRTASR